MKQLSSGAQRPGSGSSGVFDEQRHRRGKSVQRVAACDRADLPGGEEAGERNPAKEFLDGRRVMVGDPEHPPPTPVAGEQQRANWTPGQRRSRPLYGQAQVLVGPRRVTDLELYGRADLDNLADLDRPGRLVGAEQPADQEVALTRSRQVLVDDDPDL